MNSYTQKVNNYIIILDMLDISKFKKILWMVPTARRAARSKHLLSEPTQVQILTVNEYHIAFVLILSEKKKAICDKFEATVQKEHCQLFVHAFHFYFEIGSHNHS